MQRLVMQEPVFSRFPLELIPGLDRMVAFQEATETVLAASQAVREAKDDIDIGLKMPPEDLTATQRLEWMISAADRCSTSLVSQARSPK